MIPDFYLNQPSSSSSIRSRRSSPSSASHPPWPCAVVEVEIAGVDHEYSAIEGVQEDVIEMLLNLNRTQPVESLPYEAWLLQRRLIPYGT